MYSSMNIQRQFHARAAVTEVVDYLKKADKWKNSDIQYQRKSDDYVQRQRVAEYILGKKFQVMH
jgi:hypothetical protein